MNTKTIESKNKAWGFFGTCAGNYALEEIQLAEIYDLTARKLIAELGISTKQARCFLDSKSGRHFADQLSFCGASEAENNEQFMASVYKSLNHFGWILVAAEKQEIYE